MIRAARRRIGHRARIAACAGLLPLAAAGAARAAPLRVFAAGSLAAVMPALIAAAGIPPADVAPVVSGPAGALARRLRAGAHADLFASADRRQAMLVAAGTRDLVVAFARNRMCLLARARDGITPATLLDRILAPGFRLATSTPGNDPGGDYALAVFARADAVRPGAGATLARKALHLLGGAPPGTMVATAGRDPVAAIFDADRADGLLYYCSGTDAAARRLPGLGSLALPAALEVTPVYAMAVDPDDADARRLALLMVSDTGQAILARGGLLPLDPGGAPPADAARAP